MASFSKSADNPFVLLLFLVFLTLRSAKTISSPTGPPAFLVNPTNFCRLGKIHVFSQSISLTAPMVVSGDSDVRVMRSLAHLAISVTVGVVAEAAAIVSEPETSAMF